MKHHFGVLPHYFNHFVMPTSNIDHLQNKIARISLDEIYKIPLKY